MPRKYKIKEHWKLQLLNELSLKNVALYTVLICSSLQRKFTECDSSTSGRSKAVDFLREGNSSQTGYLNESSSSDSDFNLNSSMPHHSDIDISGPRTGNNGEFP
jgi:hypothetical protein